MALVCVYAGLPLLIAGALEARLTASGFAGVQVICGYPSWNLLRLDEMRLVRHFEGSALSIRVAGTMVTYRPLNLLAGRIESMHIAKVEIGRTTSTADASAFSSRTDNFPALLAMELAELPMRQLSIDVLEANWGDHVISATGLLSDGAARIQGRILPATGQAVKFSASISGHGEAHLQFLPAEGQAPPLLDLDSRITPKSAGAMRLEGSLRAQVKPVAALLGSLADGSPLPDEWSGSLDSHWQGEIPRSPQAGHPLRIDSEHHLELQSDRLGDALEQVRIRMDVSGSLRGDRLQWRIGKQSSLSARLAREGGETSLDMDFPEGISGRAEFGAGEFTLTFLPGFPVRGSPLRWGGLSLAENRIELVDAVTLRHEKAPGRWSSSPLNLAAPGLVLRWPDGEARTGAIQIRFDELRLDADGGKGNGSVRAEAIQPVFRGKSLPLATLEMPFRMAGTNVDAQARLALGQGGIVLGAQARHDLAGGSGQVRFELKPPVFAESGGKLSDLLAPWRSPLELHAGSVFADGRLDWRGSATGPDIALDGQMNLRLEGIAGHYGIIGFADLSANLALSEHDGLRTSEPARLTIGRLDIGFPVTDLQVTSDMTLLPGSPAGRLHELSLGLLGGTARAEDVRWDLSASSHPLAVTLQGLSLTEIVALEKRDDLQAKGILDGHLPLLISKAGIAVHGGELHARPPGGFIRYRPTAEATSMANHNASMKILLQALANLHYQTLKVNADSTPAGDLTLKVALKGRNPEWQLGRPIHLNLRLQENIPKLWRSLHVADDIDTRIQEHYRNNR